MPSSEQQTIQDVWQSVDIAAVTRELSATLHAHETVADTLLALAHAAVRVVPGAQWCSITVWDDGRVSTPGFSHPECIAIDEIQVQTGEGPCLQAIRDDSIVRMDDVAHDGRFPAWSERVVELGVRSALAVRLEVPGRATGALNVFADGTDAFDMASETVAIIVASHASGAMTQAERAEQLRDALSGRDVIGQAKGRIMERFGVDGEQAFEILRQLSRDSNTKLRDVAREVATERSVDGAAGPPGQRVRRAAADHRG